MAMRYRRRRRVRKNPALSTGTILLAGGIAAGAYYFFVHRKATAVASPRLMIGGPGPAGTGPQPVLAAGAGFVFKRDPGGGPMCFTAAGARAPLSKCSALQATADASSSIRKLVGLGSLGHAGLGSLA